MSLSFEHAHSPRCDWGVDGRQGATDCMDGFAYDDRGPSPEALLMHDPVNMLLADTYARRHGFKDFCDARPIELMAIIVEDVQAIREALTEAGYEIAPARVSAESSPDERGR